MILLFLGWFHAVAMGTADLQQTVIFISANQTPRGHSCGRGGDDTSGAGCRCKKDSMDVGWALRPQLGFLHESWGHRDIPTQSRALVFTRVQGWLGELLPCSASFRGL